MNLFFRYLEVDPLGFYYLIKCIDFKYGKWMLLVQCSVNRNARKILVLGLNNVLNIENNSNFNLITEGPQSNNHTKTT